MLGRPLVHALAARGHTVVRFARHAVGDGDGAGAHADGQVESVRGDLRTAGDLARAADGVDAIVHAATSPRRHARATEVDGVRNALAAASASGAHLVYVSIVGVDRHRFPYYRAKWAAEQLVAASAGRWTILRATQFHELLDGFLAGRVFVRTPDLAFQPVAAEEVAVRLAELAEAGPTGRAPDFGGPEVLAVRELAAVRREVVGRAARLVPLPRLGPLRDFDAGVHLCPDHRAGRTTWRQWLRARPQAPARAART
jgi:uncharacterized protein YbjT (DUF2867 family)